MEKRKRIYYALGGFILGVLVTLVIWLCVVYRTGTGVPADSEGVSGAEDFGDGEEGESRADVPEECSSSKPDTDLDREQPTTPAGTQTKAPEEGDHPKKDGNPDGEQQTTPAGTPTKTPEKGDYPNEDGNLNGDGNPGGEPSTTPAGTPTKVPEEGDHPIGDGNPDEEQQTTPAGTPTKVPEEGDHPKNDGNPDGEPLTTPAGTPTKVPEEGDHPKKDEDPDGGQPATPANTPTKAPEEGSIPDQDTDPAGEDSIAVPEPSADAWDKSAVYTGGDTVSYQGRRYRAKWWTQGEVPDRSDVWENLGVVDGEPTKPEGVENTPVDASIPKDTELTDFKVVGYYPSWKPGKLSTVDFGVLTHVCYAFAIPTSDGGLRDLENPETAKALIKSAHANGAKVLLSIGGWSYNDTPLENVFMEATSDDARISRFAENIIAMCEKYGFDGVDMDWEHPRVDGTSAKQYEALMLALSEKLHAGGKLLTAAVLSGATADGNIYYDAAAHTNAVLNAVDFINIMAYDGGDGERHSQYQFAVDCGTYWKETRGLPAHKVVLGVPFYARPSWADYGTIVEAVPDAHSKDHVTYNGMDVYYNGVDTIAKKTRYAKENLGGIMIWELTQDTVEKGKSLLRTIGENLQ